MCQKNSKLNNFFNLLLILTIELEEGRREKGEIVFNIPLLYWKLILITF